jgi:dihydrofolate reductase
MVGRHPAVPHPGLCSHPPSAARRPDERRTTFDFLDASPAQALAQARQAAAGGDVRIGGGPATIREFLAAGLIDYAHIVVVPIVLGRGERLWDGLEGLEERFQIEAVNSPSGVTHVTLSRR